MPKSGQSVHRPTVLRLGTRGSLLAIAQSKMIARKLQQQHDDLHVELITIRTTGDRITDRSLADVGGKGLFIKELEQALLAGSIDFAVHSYKDVPVTMPLVDESELIIASVPRRADPRDVLVGRSTSIDKLPNGAHVGTGSLRRRCQLLRARPDLQIEPIRGNIDTRLRKLREGAYDAIVLAMAGIERAGLFDPQWMRPLDVDQMLPSPGQGALALQCRKSDESTAGILRSLDDPDSALCVTLEREIVHLLNGDCHSPIAALAAVEDEKVRLRAAVGQTGGELPIMSSEVLADRNQCHTLPNRCVRGLR